MGEYSLKRQFFYLVSPLIHLSHLRGEASHQGYKIPEQCRQGNVIEQKGQN